MNIKWFDRKSSRTVDKLLTVALTSEHQEMTLRAEEALQATVEATATANRQAEEAARLFGTIRREIAITKAAKGRST